MKETDKVLVEMTVGQLRTTAYALDSYMRLCCMQFDDFNLWNNIYNVQKNTYKDILSKEKIEEFKEQITAVQHQFIGRTGAYWNASPYVRELYHIEKSLKPILCTDIKKKDPRHSCCACDGACLTDEMEKIIVKQLKGEQQ